MSRSLHGGDSVVGRSDEWMKTAARAKPARPLCGAPKWAPLSSWHGDSVVGRSDEWMKTAARAKPARPLCGAPKWAPLIVLSAAAVVALLIVPAAFAVKAHVRVEGKTRNIFGPTAPLVDVNSSALDALQSASALGEFYYHVTVSPFGPYVDQVGLFPAVGQTGWVYKINGASPPVGADKAVLEDGDTVLWYWAQFGIAGGPKTLVLARVGKSNCYRVQLQDDNGAATPALGAVLHVGKRDVRTQGATQGAVGCVGAHRGLLVRATLAGAVRSNAVA